MKPLLTKTALAIPGLLLLIVYLGDSYREPRVTTPLFFALLGVWVVAVARYRPEDFSPDVSLRSALWVRVGAAVALGLGWILLSGRPYQGMKIFGELSGGAYVPLGLAALGLLVIVVRPPSFGWSSLILVGAGLAVRGLDLWQWEIDPARRDMLPLVQSAIDRFMSGENPYGLHQMQVGSQVPLTYPPGLWLAHLPARVAGLDIRWTGWLADGALAATALVTTLKRARGVCGPVFLAMAIYLFLPDTHWNGIYAEPNFDWALVTILCFSVLWERPWATSLLLGFALTTRPFNIVLVPLFIAHWVRQFGFLGASRLCLGSGLVAGLFYVPFVLADPDAFYLGTVRWLLGYGEAHSTWFHGMLGVSGILYEAKLGAWIAPLQLAGTLLLVVLGVWRIRTPRGLLVFSTMAYGVLVAFNSIIWMSFWIGVCLLAVTATGAAGFPAKKGKGTLSYPPRPMATVFDLLAGGAVAVALAGMLVLLAGHFSEDGRLEAREYVLETLEPAQLVLDLSGPQVSFLKLPAVLEKQDLPPMIRFERQPFGAAFVRPRAKRNLFEAPRVIPSTYPVVTLVDRDGSFAQVAAIFAGAFEETHRKDFGRFQVRRLKRVARGEQIGTIAPGVRGGTSAATIALPRSSEPLWLTVYGKYPRRNLAWGLPPVTVEVVLDGAVLEKHEFGLTPHYQGFTLPVPKTAEGVLTLEKSSADQAANDVLMVGATLYR